MENSSNDYHISFFKPTTPQALANRNMVIWFVSIWALAIFGFHILLRVIEKPTPEPAYTVFENVWGNVQNGNASVAELQDFGKSTLSVLGKVAISANDKSILNNAFSWSVYQAADDSAKEHLLETLKSFESLKASIENISDPNYISAKMELSREVSPMLGLSGMDIRSKILPLELSSVQMFDLTDDTKQKLPAVMGKYLIHNQSFLTDVKFLGFPFHYFYTAIFLLVLFVGLCWLYCYKTDKLNEKLNIAD